MPSRLRRLYWSIAYEDIKTKIRLRSTYEQVKIMQDFQSMAEILSAAFGGNKQTSGASNTAKGSLNVMQPRNREEAKWMLAKVLGRKA